MFSIVSSSNQQLDQIRAAIIDAHRSSTNEIPSIRTDVKEWATASKRILRVFDENISFIENSIHELQTRIEGKETLSGRVYNFIYTTAEHISEKISDIYQAIIQDTSIKDVRTERLLLDAAGDLEEIFVSRAKGGHQRAVGDYPVPTPEKIYESFHKEVLDELCAEYAEEFKELEKRPSCFVSYEWSHPKIVHMLSDHLKAAGIDVFIDIDQGPEINRDLDNMEAEILNKDFVLAMCTLEYGKKARGNRKSGVRDEIKPIISRHSGKWDESPVIRVLLSGRPSKSFPPNMTDDRSVYADLRHAKSYKSVLIKLLERFYWDSVTDNPAHQAFIQKKNALT